MTRSPSASRTVDPITFEVVRNALSSIADEMALVILRSAYSPVVRDAMDYSTAVCDRQGQVVAQGLTLAVQLGSFPDVMEVLLREFRDDMVPGDIFICNDPYGSGGQHLPDLYVIKPLFVDGAVHGYAATMAHHSDVGGIAPGSVAIHATEIYQEGLRLPLLKLYEAGEPDRKLFRIIEKNTRSPVQVLGDLRAQLAACRIAERGFGQLVDRYGVTELETYLEELHDFAETRMRAEIGRIPDGTYRFVDWIDGVGDEPERLPIAVTVTVDRDEIALDFAGSAGQVLAAINCPMAMVRSAAYCAIRCLATDDIPNCEGYMRPIRMSAPAGTIVNPVEPAACAARGVIGYRVFDAIMGAIAEAVPELVIAGCEGGPTLFSVGGHHEGKPFVLTEVLVSTWGARAARDGVEGISNPAANLSNQPVELIEAELPLEVTRYGLVPDSGGAGKHRGGLASVREFRFLAERSEFTIRTDRRAHPPYGIAGGRPGAPSANTMIDRDGDHEVETMPLKSFIARRDDLFRMVSAGGGGYGDPRERDPTAVLEDVREEKLTRAAARDVYGVVITEEGALDVAATRALRGDRVSEAAP
ncbi:MAG: hydantoinase B/oxoprolinase family protein [Gemmatimonadetes bacterium]|nr:hydantoinase B/oxoprolinase family protein [Candidatus Palauibacter australiensis]